MATNTLLEKDAYQRTLFHQAHHHDYTAVKLHCTDTGEVVMVSRAVLLYYPVFCGMDTLDEIFLPGVSKEDLEAITSLPVSDSRFDYCSAQMKPT